MCPYSYLFIYFSIRRTCRAWNHCDSVQDFLSIFDGRSTEFPELARICGGDSLPDIISSGPDMLIVFQTSPYDSLFHPTPVSYLLGFELQVEVSYIPFAIAIGYFIYTATVFRTTILCDLIFFLSL